MRRAWGVILMVAALASGQVWAAADGRAETVGPTYRIGEQDLLEAIEQKLREKERTGELERLKQEAIKRSLNSVENPKPVAGITKAGKSRTFYYDPAIVTQQPIVDQTGRVLFPAGTRVNPLDYVSLSKHLIFIDSRDEEQVQFSLDLLEKYKGRAKVILTGGSYLKLMRRVKFQVYYDQYGILTKRFGIQHVPALVSQEGQKLRIDEVAL